MKSSRLFFLFTLFVFSFSIADESWVSNCSIVCSNSVWDTGINRNSDPNVYTFWQSNDGSSRLALSAVENDFLQKIEPQQISIRPQYNNKNIEDFHPAEWSGYCTKITGVEPSKWSAEERKELFDNFELWIHPNFRIFIESLPDFYEYFLETYEESFHNSKLKEKIENNYVETNWYNPFSGTTIKNYFEKNYLHAKKVVEANIKRKREEQDRLAKEAKIKRQRKQEQIAQQKRKKAAERVQQYFLDQEERIESIAAEFHEKAERAYIEFEQEENEITNRYQQRMESFQSACDNFFHAEHKLYDVSERTSSLLKKQNIDPAQFAQCTGNAIQQQFHREFVDVLNNSADLTDFDFCFDSQLLFFAVSDLSRVGSICNNVGQISLAQQFADTCWEVYSTGKFASMFYELGKEELENYLWAGACTLAKEIYKDPKGCAIEVKEFCSNVFHKAIIRPIKNLDSFIEANKKDPNLIPKIVGKVLQNMMVFAANQHALEIACRDNPHSPAAQELFDNFNTNYMQPLNRRVSKAVKDFRDMPTKEKAEEFCAFLVQMGVIKFVSGSVKVVGAAAESLEASAFFDDILANAGISGGGAISVSVPVVAGVSTGIATGIADAVEVGGLAGLGLSNVSFFMGQGREVVKKTRIRPPLEIFKRYKNLKPKSPLVKGTFDKAALDGVEIPKRLKFDQRVAEHVFESKGKLVRSSSGTTKSELSGFHADYKWKASKRASVKIKNKVRHPETGAIEADVMVYGNKVKKTLFSPRLTPEEVWNMVIESVGNVTKIIPQGNRFQYYSIAKDGTPLVIIAEANGEVVTFFPKAFTNNFGKI